MDTNVELRQSGIMANLNIFEQTPSNMNFLIHLTVWLSEAETTRSSAGWNWAHMT